MTGDPARIEAWRSLTRARIGLARTGVSQTTDDVLRFALDHARARDAVWTALDTDGLALALGGEVIRVRSAAPDRATYLARPDLGARLDAESAARFDTMAGPAPDLVIVLGDGLSSRALDHAPGLVARLRQGLDDAGWRLAPLVLATQARVALGDEIGQRLRAAMALVLIGERPGLSSPASLGAYLTWAPAVGRTNAERNCVSNIGPQGQTAEQAAFTLLWLLQAARRLSCSGIGLKDESNLKHLGPDALRLT